MQNPPKIFGTEHIIYIVLSFLGMFFLYFPFWFAFNVEPILFN